MLITSATHFVQLFLHNCKSTRGWVWSTCSWNMQNTTRSHPPPHPPVTKRGRSWLAVAEPGLPAPPAPFPCPPRAGQTSCGPGEAAGGIRSIWAEGSLPGQAEPCQRCKSCAFPQRHDLLPLRMLCWADLPPASREGGFGYCCVSAMPGGHLGELGDLKMPCMEERKAALSSFSTLLAKAFTWETIAFRLLLYH